MKYFLSVILIIILSFIFAKFLPWWQIAVAGFVGTFFFQIRNGFKSFMIGFVAIALYWGLSSMMVNNANGGVLADKVAELVQMSGAGTLILITALIGGIVGGLGACTGDLFDQMVRKQVHINSRKTA